MKTYHMIGEWSMGEMKCPTCDSIIRFDTPGDIEVNCESKNKIQVDELFALTKKCKNPLCEWSKI